MLTSNMRSVFHRVTLYLPSKWIRENSDTKHLNMKGNFENWCLVKWPRFSGATLGKNSPLEVAIDGVLKYQIPFNINGYECKNLSHFALLECVIILSFDCTGTVNECVFNPCPNNATCIDLDNSYTCECASGFSGNSCEIGKQRVYCIIKLSTLTMY